MKHGFFYGRLHRDRVLRYHGVRSVIFRDVASFELIDGHNPYGVHRYVRMGKSPYRYVTMLRHPLEQAVSYYYFVRNTKTEYYEHPAYRDAARLNISSFYALSRYRNIQTRYLAGVEWKRFSGLTGYSGSAMLRAARRNLLERYTCFGIQERFDESVRVFSRALDLPFASPTELHKKTPGRPTTTSLSEREEATIRDANALDFALYEEASDRFVDQITTSSEGDEIARSRLND